jgi:hypothetical protein
VVALILGTASLAMAEEVTRSSYKEMVEPICQTNTKANEKILKDVRSDVKKGKLKLAGKAFAQAASALQKAYNQIQTVPQPAADEARLAKWLSYVKQEIGLFKSGSKALKSNNKHKAQQIVVKLTHTANQANSQVLAFGFHYCKLNPSKFT